jgi:hypothetical protein
VANIQQYFGSLYTTCYGLLASDPLPMLNIRYLTVCLVSPLGPPPSLLCAPPISRCEANSKKARTSKMVAFPPYNAAVWWSLGLPILRERQNNARQNNNVRLRVMCLYSSRNQAETLLVPVPTGFGATCILTSFTIWLSKSGHLQLTGGTCISL